MSLVVSEYKERRRNIGVYLATVVGVTKRNYSSVTITPCMRYMLLYGGYSIGHLQDIDVSMPYGGRKSEELFRGQVLYEPSLKAQMIELADLHSNRGVRVRVLSTPESESTTEVTDRVLLIGNSCASDHENLYVYGGFEVSPQAYNRQYKSAEGGGVSTRSMSRRLVSRRPSKLEIISYKAGEGGYRILDTKPFMNNPTNMPTARGWAVLTYAFDCLFLLGGYSTRENSSYTQPKGEFLEEFYCLKLRTGTWERLYVHSAIRRLGENFIAVVNEFGNQIQYVNNANVTFTYDADNQIWIYPPDPGQEEMSPKQLLSRILNELAATSQQGGEERGETVLWRSARGLNVPLKNHQAFGVRWLKYTETLHNGALLADSMGLGKTLQIISLILETPEKRPNLIVVPLGLLLNWLMEIKSMTQIPDEEIHVFHGKYRAIKDTDMKAKCIVLTTYHTLCVEARSPESPIWQVEFGRIVADEADILKNYEGGSFNAMSKVDGKSLILVTATPFQNQVMDLYSYFILLNLWEGLPKEFNRILVEETNANRLVEWVVERLGPIILRRVPESQVFGERAVSMPTIREEIVLCRFSPEELQEYTGLLTSLPEDVGRMGANTYLRLYSCHPYMYTWSREKNQKRKAVESYATDDADFLPEIDEDREALEIEMQLDEINSEGADRSSNIASTSMANVESTIEVSIPTERSETTEDPARVFIQDFIAGVANSTVNKHSGKTRKIVEILLDIQENKEHLRVIVFSGFNLMLDIVAYHLREHDIAHLTITGSTPVRMRKCCLDSFALPVPKDEIRVLLINIKCGAFGLNLQMASAVIIADNWWNPYVEVQAKARVWRVNQPNNVASYQLIMQDSIEAQGVIDSQTRKLGLFGKMTNILVDEASEVPVSMQLQEQDNRYMGQLYEAQASGSLVCDDDDDDDDEEEEEEEAVEDVEDADE